MFSGEDIAAGASFSDGQGRQHHARKGHRKSIMHANLAESLKIRQASFTGDNTLEFVSIFGCYGDIITLYLVFKTLEMIASCRA